MFTVGIPKEIKALEKRVGLTPQAVGELRRQKIRVLVQSGAGEGSHYSDEQYKAKGAQIVPDAKSVYRQANLIQKVKEPQPPEFGLLHKDQILFSFLHLASPAQREVVHALKQSGVTAIGYETVEKKGLVPLLAPMSEIAGGLSAGYAGFFHERKFLKMKKENYPSNLIEELEAIARVYPEAPKNLKIGNVVIFGGGSAGKRAMEIALQMKGHVTLIEKDSRRLKDLRIKMKKTKGIEFCAPEERLETAYAKADVFIGCVHVPGHKALHILSRDHFKKVCARKKKIIMDVAIDQGGNFPESRVTQYPDPVYVDSYGNLRFGVTNIPSLCGKGATEALSRRTVVYTIAMAKNFEEALWQFPELVPGINVIEGRVVHPAVIQAHPQ